MLCKLKVRAILGEKRHPAYHVSPYHPASNGLAERVVQIVKQGLKKMMQRNLSNQLAKVLFSYRTTPQTTTGVALAELLCRRNPHTRFHNLYSNWKQVIEDQQLKQKQDHDKRAQVPDPGANKTSVIYNFGRRTKIWKRHVDHICWEYDLDSCGDDSEPNREPDHQPRS